MLLGEEEELCEKADFLVVFVENFIGFMKKCTPLLFFSIFSLKMELSNAFLRFYNTKKATLPC